MLEALIALAALLAGYAAARGIDRLRLKRNRDAVQHAGQTIDRTLSDFVLENDQLREAVERARKRGDELFQIIDSAVAEKNNAMQLYHRQAAEHGNAQAMMLREIGRVSQQYEWLRQTLARADTLDAARELAKRTLRRNAALEHIAAEFSETHIVPHQATPVSEQAGNVG